MQNRISEYYNWLETLRKPILKLVREISEEELNFKPLDRTNSIGIILRHTCGAEKFWIGEVVGKIKSHRIRKNEFETNWIKKKDILRLLIETQKRTKKVFSNLKTEELEQKRAVNLYLTTSQKARDYGKVTVLWAIQHNLEHFAQHSGQIMYIHKLYTQCKEQKIW